MRFRRLLRKPDDTSQCPDGGDGLLGDTTTRDYSLKLRLFNSFAEPELRRAIAGLGLKPGARVLDAGCGTGEALPWLMAEVGPEGSLVGIDVAAAHVKAARRHLAPGMRILQANLLDAPVPPASFDAIWCVNTINHLQDPVLGVRRLGAKLLPGGRIALGQSSFLPDMYFAWDARLERLINEAVRRYYEVRYGLVERDLAGVRSLVGVLRRAGLRNIIARTLMIERLCPLGPADEAYLLDAIFRNTWGTRLRPYLSDDDYAELGRLCDPQHPQFALRRPDFHFLQTFTLTVGEI
jgi:SAM-dependent methyltransferase